MLEHKGTPITSEAWELTNKEFEKLCQETPEFVELIDQLLTQKWLKVKVSDRPDEMGPTFRQEDRKVFETQSAQKLYSLVDFQTDLNWGQVPMKKQSIYDGEKLEISRNNTDTKMGLDGFGYYWGQYALSNEVRVRITYLHNESHPFAQHPGCFPTKTTTTRPEFSELLLGHQQDLDSLKTSDFMSSIFGSSSRSLPELPDSIQGFRFLSVKIPVCNSAINSMLGSHHSGWVVEGAQMKGGFQINSKTALNLKMESVVVSVMRGGGGGGPLTQDGYLDFFDDSKKFSCLYEVFIQDKLVFATLGNHDNHRGSS